MQNAERVVFGGFEGFKMYYMLPRYCIITSCVTQASGRPLAQTGVSGVLSTIPPTALPLATRVD